MRRWIIGAGLVLTLVAASSAAAQNQVPDCVTVRAIVRYGAGAYNHWVRVENDCARRVRCQIATDVNPDPVARTIEPGESTEVMTFMGSPAREFTPRVSCQQD
jgi:hypothetical protein